MCEYKLTNQTQNRSLHHFKMFCSLFSRPKWTCYCIRTCPEKSIPKYIALSATFADRAKKVLQHLLQFWKSTTVSIAILIILRH